MPFTRRRAGGTRVPLTSCSAFEETEGSSTLVQSEQNQKLDHPLTAVCCYNDMTALGAMRAIHARGLRVPEGVSVTGFDDLFFAANMQPPLTTVRQPMRRMGEMAMENLFRLTSGEESAAQIRVEAELIVRGSTAKVNARVAGRRHG